MGDWRSWMLWCATVAVIGCISALTPHCVDDQRERHSVAVASRFKSEHREIRACRRAGGFWTPVGGDGYGSHVYGCVFPLRSP